MPDTQNSDSKTSAPTKKFDWLWNTLTVTCLILTSSFVANTLHAFSKDGVDLLQTFGAISQGAGLILVTGGTLTAKGKQVITGILSSLKIPSDYQAKITFALAALILLITYWINHSLPLLGQHYYEQGKVFYQESKLSKAESSFEQALNFSPDNSDISVALGNVYETMGSHDKAKPLYQMGANAGHPESLNGLGRVQMRSASSYEDLLTAEASFRLGLTQPGIAVELKSEILSHLGITLIKQAELNKDKISAIQFEATRVLEEGIKVDKTITERTPGLGLSYCYLAILQKTSQSWDNCVEHVLPTSTSQYRDILFYAKPSIAEKINTSGIVKE